MNSSSVVLTTILACCCAAWSQHPASHLDHVHLNSADPAAAVRFYTSHFECESDESKPIHAIRAHKSRLLFDRTDSPPPSAPVSAIWHIGWGAEDMPAEYRRQLDRNTRFATPITDISELAGVRDFYYAYVDGPDHALIELNTAPHHRFGHIHLFSADPVAAGDFYEKYFGLERRGGKPASRERRYYKGLQVAPAASLLVDGVSILIFPVEHARQTYPGAWKGRTALAPTRGRVFDHLAFRVPDRAALLGRMRADGLAVDSAFIQGPDGVSIELVQEP